MSPTCVEDMPSVSGWVRTPVTELATVICRPSRIQAPPSPRTMRVWNGDQCKRSSRAGMVDRILPVAVAVMTPPPEPWPRGRYRPSVSLRSRDLRHALGEDDPRRGLDQREMGERLRHVP